MNPSEMIKILKSELKEYKKAERAEKYADSVLEGMTDEELYPNFLTAYEEVELRNPE